MMSYFKENDVVFVVHNHHSPKCAINVSPGIKKLVKDDDGILRAEDRRASGLKDFCYCKNEWKLLETNCNTTQVGGEHYKKHTIQPWSIIDEYGLNYYEGNVLKYLLREKGDRLEDLQKARHYIDKLIEMVSPQMTIGAFGQDALEEAERLMRQMRKKI